MERAHKEDVFVQKEVLQAELNSAAEYISELEEKYLKA